MYAVQGQFKRIDVELINWICFVYYKHAFYISF